MNAQIREFCRMEKGLDDRIDERVLRWFGHVDRRERDEIAKRVYEESVLVVVKYVGCGLDRYHEEVLEEKRFGYQASKENGAR